MNSHVIRVTVQEWGPLCSEKIIKGFTVIIWTFYFHFRYDVKSNEIYINNNIMLVQTNYININIL